jgi:predicted HicB family RNase H-like nuclease
LSPLRESKEIVNVGSMSVSIDVFCDQAGRRHSSVTVSKKYIHPTAKSAKSLEGAFERLEDYNGRAAESLLKSQNNASGRYNFRYRDER